MNLAEPIERAELEKRTRKKYQSLTNLIKALNQKELTDEFVKEINSEIVSLNSLSHTNEAYAKRVKNLHHTIYNRAIKELKLIPKNYYMVIWLSVGMAAFGVPFGMLFSIVLDNFAFIGIGLPIGLSMGIALGASMDKKAEKEGRQLNIEAA